MTCRQLSEFLMQYISGELPAELRAVFAAHLASCPECLAYVPSYEATVRLAQQVGDDDAALGTVPEKLVGAILAARRRALS